MVLRMVVNYYGGDNLNKLQNIGVIVIICREAYFLLETTTCRGRHN